MDTERDTRSYKQVWVQCTRTTSQAHFLILAQAVEEVPDKDRKIRGCEKARWRAATYSIIVVTVILQYHNYVHGKILYKLIDLFNVTRAWGAVGRRCGDPDWLGNRHL
jgi:hypothetical protein